MRAISRFSPLLCLFLASLTASAAPPISRRSFFKSASLCVAATLLPSFLRLDLDLASRRRWSMHPEFDIVTLGLESFGNSVKELLLRQGYVSDPAVAERLRWNLQSEIWNRLEPKGELTRAKEDEFIVAIPLERNRYLYLNPHFRIEPLAAGDPARAERTVGKVEYVSDTRDFRVLTYWFDGAPTDSKILVVSTE